MSLFPMIVNIAGHARDDFAKNDGKVAASGETFASSRNAL
jgi:hypothetical protein